MACCFLQACQKSPIGENIQLPSDKYSISLPAALSALEEMQNSIMNQDLSKSSEPKRISDISFLLIDDILPEQTKSNSNSFDTLMYVVNYANDGGWAILAADSRFPSIVAVTESGNYHPSFMLHSGPLTKSIQGQVTIDHMLNKFITYTVNDPRDNSGDDLGNNGSGNGDVVVGNGGGSSGDGYISDVAPMLKTKWSQDEPYNLAMPIENGKRAYAGCGNIATIQTMIYNKRSTLGDVFGIDSLDWYDIQIEYVYNTHEKALLIANIIGQVCIGTNSDVNCDGKGSTLTFLHDITPYLRAHGYPNAKRILGYSQSSMISMLTARKPVIISAVANLNSAHTWVIDGMQKYGFKNREILYHCNFGWGGNHDGYYHSKVFDTGTGPVMSSITKGSEGDYDELFRYITY